MKVWILEKRSDLLAQDCHTTYWEIVQVFSCREALNNWVRSQGWYFSDHLRVTDWEVLD